MHFALFSFWCFFVPFCGHSSSRPIVSQKTWGGRFAGGTDARVEAFTESISYDRRLYRHDARASQAHARMLAAVGLLSAGEAETICQCLDRIAARIDRGEFTFST